jgi:hypothetical protein
MTDEDIELFLSLKFPKAEDVIAAFRKAAGIPPRIDTTGADSNVVAQAIRYWAELGCPEYIDIPREDAELFLILKFGSIDAAWDYVMSRPPGEHHGLSDSEILMVMDYVKPPNKN